MSAKGFGVLNAIPIKVFLVVESIVRLGEQKPIRRGYPLTQLLFLSHPCKEERDRRVYENTPSLSVRFTVFHIYLYSTFKFKLKFQSS